MSVVIYNSQDPYYKTPFGALRAGEFVTFTLKVPIEYECKTPYLIINRDGEAPAFLPMKKGRRRDGVDVFSFSCPLSPPGLYFYYFDLYTGFRKLYAGKLGEAYVTTGEGEPWQLTVYEKDFQTPEHLRGGMIYQIFPDRFYESKPHPEMPFPDRVYRDEKFRRPYFWPNEQHEGYLNMDYYGGDLPGIQEKLPYLADLGVTCIYLNPIFEAHANHRYNTANYRKVDPVLGTNEDFAALCAAAKGYGIDIILDGVFSHTGSDSIYFNREGRYDSLGAWQSEESPYRSWYDFSPHYSSGYRCWWGFETLPEVNESDRSYRDFICGEGGVIDYWLGLGAAGFRLDVADELPDNFIEEIRRAIKRHGGEKYLLGEVWEDATNKWSYGVRRTYLLGKGLDAVMNYPFKEATLAFLRGGDARDAADVIMRICEHYPAPALHVLMNFVSTHDTVRAITALAGESCEGRDRYWQSEQTLSPEQYEAGIRLLRLAYVMVFTLPGIPSVYYGDEIGMQGYKDPFNRAYFNWDSAEDRVRPVIREMAALRKRCPAFANGTLRVQHAEGGVFCYERRAENAVASICVNRTPDAARVIMLGRETEIPPFSYTVATKP